MQIKLFEFNFLKVNTYLIYDETKEAIIIDCGVYTSKECMELKKIIDFHHLQLKYLINTHTHFDHILGNYFIYKNYGLKPQYHQLEKIIPNLKVQSYLLNIPINYNPILAEHYINEKNIISFGNITLKAILTPGHSPGGLSFYCEKNNCIFTGDTLFYHSIGRTDLWGGNQKTLISSIKNKIFILPDNTKIFPGHGQFSSIKEEKKHNLYIE